MKKLMAVITQKEPVPVIDENKIEMTLDYNLFKKLRGNREVDEGHVQKLMKLMRQNDLFTPITVNENFEVIDGQHRLEARRRLGLIVPYFVVKNYGLAEVQAINSQQKRWTVDDYAQSYIELGKKDYEIYKWFRKRYKLPHIVTVELLHEMTKGHGKLSDIFNSGSLRVKNLEGAKSKAETLELIAPYFDGYCDRNFVIAFFTVQEKKVFDLKKFISKLENQPNALKKCAKVSQYIDLIEEIYNYRSQSKVSLRYSD
jgi:hypothetical protein